MLALFGTAARALAKLTKEADLLLDPNELEKNKKSIHTKDISQYKLLLMRINSIFDTDFSIVKCIQHLSLFASVQNAMHNHLDQVAIHLKSYASSLDSLYNKLLLTPCPLRDTCNHVLGQINYALGVISYRLIKPQPEDHRVSNFTHQLNNRGWVIDPLKFDQVSAKN